jgi:hypothetical protein
MQTLLAIIPYGESWMRKREEEKERVEGESGSGSGTGSKRRGER